jgi:2-polyprenyl-3-methyl-5-hydroxy-6-metoxy-1,4-benzoquinol methylase
MNHACPICADQRVRLERTIGHFEVCVCEQCGLYWVSNVTEAELISFYEESYFRGDQEFGYIDYTRSEPIHRLNAHHLLREAAAFLPTPGALAGLSLCDVGCAYGFLVDEATRAGMRAEGVDYSAQTCEYARKTLGCRVFHGALKDAGFPASSFDVVTIIGSIEHLSDPVGTVAEIARICKPGGLMVITTIDTKAFFGIFRFKPPEHLFYFSRANLSLLVQKQGFEVVKLTGHRAYHNIGEALGLFSKAVFGPRVPIERLIRRSPLKSARLKLPNNEMLLIARKTSSR